jgi:hypothetical protein
MIKPVSPRPFVIIYLLAPPRCPDGEADIVMRELGN